MPLSRPHPLLVRASRNRRRVFAALLVGFGALVEVRDAAADPMACRRFRVELAGLNDGASTARALQTEIGRLQAYARSLNCEGGRFLFFDTRPPQCGAVEQRIKALNAGYGGENGEVVAARRRHLQAAVATACAAAPADNERQVASEQTARGGLQVICVKTCDGSYFPMNNLPDGRGGAPELCQALCPGTEAVAYSMPYGDEALRYAATLKGNRAYAALPTAYKFRTSFTPNCSCKRDGQSWAQSLAKAESMLVRHKGDIFVTPMQAEALSRPKVRLTLVGRADRTAATLAADAASRGASERAEPPPGETVPASEGNAETGPVTRPAIRVIAPETVPVPVNALMP